MVTKTDMEEISRGSTTIGFKCKLCHYRSTSPISMDLHILRHEMDRNASANCENSIIEKYFCRKCDFTTHLSIAYTEHFLKCHRHKSQLDNRVYRIYICKECKFVTNFILKWFKHVTDNCRDLSRHFPENEISCLECNYRTRTIFFLRRHMTLHHSDKSVWFECDDCDYKTISSFDLNLHQIARHTPHDEIDWLRCDQCDYKTKTKKGLLQHVNWNHSRVEWLKCVYCDFKTRRKRSLSLHQIAKHLSDDEVSWFECDQLNYKSKAKSFLQKHSNDGKVEKPLNKSLDGKIVRFKCIHCGYKTYFRGSFERHQMLKHNWNECEQCDYKAKTRDELRGHITDKHKELGHHNCETKEAEEVKCDHCDYKTKRAANLKRHHVRMHTPKGRMIHWLKCHQCKFKTKQKIYLARHIKAHHLNVIPAIAKQKRSLHQTSECSPSEGIEESSDLLKEKLRRRWSEKIKLTAA